MSMEVTVRFKETETIFPPIITDFVCWVLQSALSKSIYRLYFLARDGYIMLNTAKIIAEKYNINIELRYLYCSRISLRTAALSDLGEEAYQYLLESGYALTPKVILGRLMLNREERKKTYDDIEYTGDENNVLCKAAAAEFCDKLKSSDVYNGYIRSVSARCKKNTVAYLEQEGLLSDTSYGIVDSGWTGSMQRMLTVLTGRQQTGFYFGMYVKPSAESGEFNSYLFDKSTSPFIVSKFNNNLFEAVCSAPHGMTVGYKNDNGIIVPVLKGKSLNCDNELIPKLEQLIYCYAKEKNIFPPKAKSMKERQKNAFSLLDELMYRPDKATAGLYGSLKFSDDAAELNNYPLAAKLQDPRTLYFIPRLINKFFKKGSKARKEEPVFWEYGTAVLSGKGWFCRLNLRLWKIIWLKKRKSG